MYIKETYKTSKVVHQSPLIENLNGCKTWLKHLEQIFMRRKFTGIYLGLEEETKDQACLLIKLEPVKWEFFHAVAVTTIVWLHHLDSKKMIKEKARWVLNKDTECYFKQILEAAPFKTVPVWPLISHLVNHASKISKPCCILLEKQGQTHKQCFSMNSYI